MPCALIPASLARSSRVSDSCHDVIHSIHGVDNKIGGIETFHASGPPTVSRLRDARPLRRRVNDSPPFRRGERTDERTSGGAEHRACNGGGSAHPTFGEQID